MRRILQLSVFCLAAGVVTACKLADTVQTTMPPLAAIRFLNAVPDTNGVDFRPVDIVENTHFYGMTFRSTTLFYYKAAQAGSRHFRIFLSDTLQSVATIVLKDTTVTLEEGKHYTFILWGNARGGATPMKLSMIEDNPADPGTQVALRVVNATSAALDVRQYTGATVPPAPNWATVAPLSASTYLATAPASIKYNVQPAGGGTPLFADATALAGAPATIDQEALPGTTIPGSAVSGFVVPASVAGSKAATFAAPGIIFVWDRRPPRTTP